LCSACKEEANKSFEDETKNPNILLAIVVGAIFCTHIACIWMYGLLFYFLNEYTQLGSFTGEGLETDTFNHDVFSHVYYSTTTYTSLGFGDILPLGGFRFLSGIEVLNGVVLIGWTVSYAFLAMQRFWKFGE
jgi:hypothetical protein